MDFFSLEFYSCRVQCRSHPHFVFSRLYLMLVLLYWFDLVDKKTEGTEAEESSFDGDSGEWWNCCPEG